MPSAHAHIQTLHAHAALYPRKLALVDGIDFCSNDYLSLKDHPVIKNRLQEFFSDAQALCSTGSRLVSGHYVHVENLETQFADFVGAQKSLFFANGYQANLAAIAGLFSSCDIVVDEHVHASLIDGIKISRSDKFIFRHNDLDDLEAKLKLPSSKPKAIVTESLFSTDGSIANCSALVDLANRYDSFLLIDESHATGIFGENGGGFLSDIRERGENIISTHSCGKALSSFGAFIACGEKIATTIINQCRQFICTTAPPPYLAVHVAAVLDLVTKITVMRDQLLDRLIGSSGILSTKTQIIAVPIGDDDRALQIKIELAKRGFSIAAFRYPSVKKNRAQLRITLHAGNSAQEINNLQHALENLL